MNAGSAAMPPADLLESLKQTLGSQALTSNELLAFASSLLQRHPNAMRMRYREEVEILAGNNLERVPWYSLGHWNQDPDFRPSRALDYAAGDYFIQDAGSMLALAACRADQPAQGGRLVCDLCAAPGGKASGLLESIGEGFLLANEPIRSRLAPLAYNLARSGSDRYVISSQDPEDLANRLGGVFDLVLADVPCSGQALLGKGKQTLASVSQSQVEHSALRGQRILDSALRLLRPGGQLVLSTCTFAEAENEDQIARLLDRGEVKPHPIETLASYQSDGQSCCYRLWPHRDLCAGSFAASVICEIESTAGWTERKKKRKQRDRLPENLADWFTGVPDRYQVAGPVIRSWPTDAPPWTEFVAAGGPELAYRTGQTWKPSHDAALRREGQIRGRRTVSVDDDSAKAFLRGEPIVCDEKGWLVVVHRDRPLGWVKASHGKGKNQLPAAARIEIT